MAKVTAMKKINGEGNGDGDKKKKLKDDISEINKFFGTPKPGSENYENQQKLIGNVIKKYYGEDVLKSRVAKGIADQRVISAELKEAQDIRAKEYEESEKKPKKSSLESFVDYTGEDLRIKDPSKRRVQAKDYEEFKSAYPFIHHYKMSMSEKGTPIFKTKEGKDIDTSPSKLASMKSLHSEMTAAKERLRSGEKEEDIAKSLNWDKSKAEAFKQYKHLY